jgi:hypothetical protein
MKVAKNDTFQKRLPDLLFYYFIVDNLQKSILQRSTNREVVDEIFTILAGFPSRNHYQMNTLLAAFKMKPTSKWKQQTIIPCAVFFYFYFLSTVSSSRIIWASSEGKKISDKRFIF